MRQLHGKGRIIFSLTGSAITGAAAFAMIGQLLERSILGALIGVILGFLLGGMAIANR
jgi:hypothetical protein